MIKLNNSYNRDDFLKFLENSFLVDFKKDIRPASTQGFSSIHKAYSLGRSESLDLQVFEFSFKGSPNKRVTLTKDAFQVMRSSAIFRALAIFHSPDSHDWRLSLMTATPQRTEKGKVSLSYSNPKRLSFFLGPDAKVNTPTKFILKKDRVKNFEDLKSRFSIEVVNKEFYQEISEYFTQLVGGSLYKGRKKQDYEALLKLPFVQDKSQTSLEFAVRLIGRIIFCWFLREKKSDQGKSLMPNDLLSLEAVKKNPDYYHKILEPIFFEVLNKPIKSRKDDYSSEAFSSIPYLNGGLFSPHDDDFYKRTNGDFQSQFHNILVIPDEWLIKFFEVLETYNFTIDENTSFDEELSIDPEMLGRIFENLLAEINPETGESARKSTGSYYTPRVIVDYMVDESLLLYLKSQTQIDEEKLRAVISYDLNDDEEAPLKDDERERVINALEKVKILDPACGSGAFPIGALQKIVFILQQVDPEGQLWFKKQIRNTAPEIKKVIEREFAHKNFDYIRKLGIIRENIYGVDIQPIATEISRLRCFLTLVVDERIQENLENRGIEPLPNLDFKFVTANTLIGLPGSQAVNQIGLFEDDAGIKELKELRDMFFNASGGERDQLKLQFVQAQNRMFQRLISEGRRGHADLTTKLTTWDPFSHKSISWFDPEWMFGIKDGFDIVIANPPYLKERDNKKIFEEINNSEFGKKYHQGKMDFWFYFLHKAIDLVKDEGCISYITSRYWINSVGAKKLIKRVKDELVFVSVVDIGKVKVFDEVVGHHMVSVYKKSKQKTNFNYIKLTEDLNEIRTNNKNTIQLPYFYIFTDNGDIVFDKNSYDTKDTVLLGEITETSIGVQESPDKLSAKQINAHKINGYAPGEGVFVLSKEEVNTLNPNTLEKSILKKYLDPQNIDKYIIRFSEKYLIYTDNNTKSEIQKGSGFRSIKKHLDRYSQFITSSNKPYGLHRPREKKYFEQPKIIFKNMFGTVGFGYDDENHYYFGFSFSSIINKDPNYDLKYILAILNSKFAESWFYKNGKQRGIGVDIGVEKLRLFPIKKINLDKQKAYVNLVNEILGITKSNNYKDSEKMIKVHEYESQLDQMIYKLYGLTEGEIKIFEDRI